MEAVPKALLIVVTYSPNTFSGSGAPHLSAYSLTFTGLPLLVLAALYKYNLK